MRKIDELTNPDSCINRALQDEFTFVLLDRDAVSPDVIKYWCYRRIAEGLNKHNDEQIQKALNIAEAMRINHSMTRIKLNHVRANSKTA